MSANRLLELWWVIPAGPALFGYLLAFAGLTRAQRAVWVKARIAEVGRPGHGDPELPAIPLTIAFRDPDTGQECALSNTGKHGDPVRVAWVGRELDVRYPPGQPHRYQVVTDAAAERSGRLGPDCAVILLYIGLVIQTAVTRGYPWALLGFGALMIVAAVRSSDIRLARARAALLASAVAVPGRVVAVVTRRDTDGEGIEIVFHTPVVTFTTREGTQVTALFRDGVPHPGRSLGRALTVHYAPTDPAVHTPDLAFDRRDRAKDISLVLHVLVLGVAAVVTGAALR